MVSEKKIPLQEIVFNSYNPFSNFELVEKIWPFMLKKCPHSFFLSWGWISTWLHTLPKDNNTLLIVGYWQGEPVVSFFLSKNTTLRHNFFFSRSINLNTTGNRYFDRLSIEYNSILADPAVTSNSLELIMQGYMRRWDELFLPGISGKMFDDFYDFEKHSKLRFNTILEREDDSFFVDLQKIRDNEMDYFKILSSHRRKQIRRSIREYEKNGEIQVKSASSVYDALSMLKNLAKLNNERWEKRGTPGAFSNRYLCEFHKSLIQECFNNNEIQILHIFTAHSTIGYLYNFIYQNRILCYQCGFKYLPHNTFRPGLVAHSLAVQFNAKINYTAYDFLAGDTQYKRTLSTNSNKIIWANIQRKKTRFWVEKQLKRLYSTKIKPTLHKAGDVHEG